MHIGLCFCSRLSQLAPIAVSCMCACRLHDEHRQRESDVSRLRHESTAASAELHTSKQRIQVLEASLDEAQERLLVASADAGTREQELEQELQNLKDRSREEVSFF
jgi:molecular chaperone GrpE (heat shock protein)